MNNSVPMPLVSVIAFVVCVSLLYAQDEAAESSGNPAKSTLPNIVFLLADDQSTDSIRCYGNLDVQTPNLDRLAREGMAFDRHYASTSICMASRASVMTGKFEFRNGCNFQHGSLLREHWLQSYPVLLRAAGYRTAIAGKIGFTVADKPFGKGILPEADFDAWGAGKGQTHYATAKNESIAAYAKDYPHSTLAYGAFGRDFIADSVRAKQPFCLSISFKAPHRPTTPDPQFDRVYAGKKFRKPANYGRDNGAHMSKQSRAGRQYPRFVSWGYADRFDEVMAVYHQQVYAIDVAVGMIRKALVDHGVADNTVVIYTSDNGFLCGSHGYGSKVLPYEESARVPLIIYDPRATKSDTVRRTRSLTGLVDIAPTILSLASIERPKGMDGRSLLPIYADPESEVHESLPLMNVWGPSATYYLGVVTRDMKYLYWPYAAEGYDASEELFMREDDPGELTNAVEGAPELAIEMRVKYDSLVTQWQTQAVAYHRYKHLGKFFDRQVPWREKAPLVEPKGPTKKTKKRR